MKRKMAKLLSILAFTISCGGNSGNNSDSYINPYATTVNGEIIQQSQTASGFTLNGTKLSFITAFSIENNKLVYSSAVINPDGTFKLFLKKELKYAFVLFDKEGNPILYITQYSNNVIVIEDNTYLKILLKTLNDGTFQVVNIEHDANSYLDWEALLEDSDNNNLPDYAEEDHNGNGLPDYDENNDGIFDGIEDTDGDGIIEGSDDTDNDHLPDPIDDDDDDDGIPDDEDDDDDNDGIPDDEDDD